MRKQKFIFILMAIITILVMIFPASVVSATGESEQIQLDATTIDQFIEPLPKLDVAGGTIQTIVAGTSQTEIFMKEFQAKMLPHTFQPQTGTYTGTWVWGYMKAGTNISSPRDTYTGPVVVATRNVPTELKYINNLGNTSTTHILTYKNSTDQSLHWANPNGVDRYISNSTPPPDWSGNPDHYSGAIPAAVHLHGGEVPAALDGGPDSWFTSTGQHGPAFYSKDGNTESNYAIYRYPNVQEAAPLWFHDHTLGATRLNVYMGLAGGYMLTDPKLKLPDGLNATGLRGGALGSNPADDSIIPLVVQDRMFDSNGQLYFPNQGINPEHPYWRPEFFGDTIAVNGKVWPYLEVKAQRYRFLLINGSNARSYELTFQNEGNIDAPTIWQIGTDQGYLDKPVQVNPLVMMPGERADIIVDFGGLKTGTKLTLNNLGPDEPFNGVVGDQNPSDPATTGKVMQFKIVACGETKDSSFNPALLGATIRSGGSEIVRLVNPANGTLAKNVKPNLTRELTLNEVAREGSIQVDGVTYEGGPLDVLINNTEWMGRKPDKDNPNNMMMPAVQSGFITDGLGNFLSELPKEGTTEIWEIVNTTMDAHPIHLHLAQFQLLNRQSYDMDKFMATYEAAFPGGSFIPEYGPPLNYSPSNTSGGKYGGNPDIAPFLQGDAVPPKANEAGWKDTIQVPSGMVTRFVVRWAPTDIPVQPNISAALRYDFLPNNAVPGKSGAIFDYVWHCHIIDHEDNEMMRPDAVVPQPQVPEAARRYRIGRDY